MDRYKFNSGMYCKMLIYPRRAGVALLHRAPATQAAMQRLSAIQQHIIDAAPAAADLPAGGAWGQQCACLLLFFTARAPRLSAAVGVAGSGSALRGRAPRLLPAG